MNPLEMSDVLLLGGSFLAGLLLGLVYFGGLWYTVQSMTRAKRPALLFFASFAVRLVVVLGAIYFLGLGDWRRMAVALLGMIVMRMFLTRRLGPARKHQEERGPAWN